MPAIHAGELPPPALLARYGATGYADCYWTDVPARVSQAQYIEAFYTTPLFRIERLILRWFVARPSTDAQARQLARGERADFAAWTVEARTADQLLLCDFLGRTRSWLMSAPQGQGTRLYFGSAVVPRGTTPSGKPAMGVSFDLLLGFHQLYSRALLGAASGRLSVRR